jgi:NAD(P)-dependent dehydrogenase (short-subunit alcohol dehydrogenase family)
MRRVCLLTGAGGRLGSAVCAALAEEYDVVATYRSRPPVIASQDARLFDPVTGNADLPENACPVFTVQADLTDSGDVARVVDITLARHDRIDLLVNAAADFGTDGALTDPRHADRWAQQLRLNAVVPVQLAATVAQAYWRADQSGNRRNARNVVNICAADVGVAPTQAVDAGHAVHQASKAALVMLTQQMALAYRPLGIRVNAVAVTCGEGVPAAQVVAAIRTLDKDRRSGRLLVVDAEGDQLG